MSQEYVPIVRGIMIQRAPHGQPAWHVEWDGPSPDLPQMVGGCTEACARALVERLIEDTGITRLVFYRIEEQPATARPSAGWGEEEGEG